MPVFKPHSAKQETCIFSQKGIVILACGIQYGKTTVGAVRSKLSMCKHTDPKDSFIITAPTYKIMHQATLPAFLGLMEGLGEYSKGDAEFRMHNGGTCYFRTATDPDSVVGITNVRHVWGDEAGLYPLYFHENLQARASFKEAPLVYTTSPYSLNWIYTDYIRPFQRGLAMEDLELVQARSDENPYFPKKEYERKKRTMDPRRFNMVYGGQFLKMQGLVYECFDDERHMVEPYTLDPKTTYIAGVDWGFTHPSVIVVIAVTPDRGCYVVGEFYQSHKTIGEVVEAATLLKRQYNIDRFICDPSGPANIVEFGKAGLSAIPADNDIRLGIDATYEMFQSDNLKIFRGRTKHLLDEITIYHYPTVENIKPDQDLKDRLPVKQHDHTMDALRYACLHLKQTNYSVKRAPKVPELSDMDLRTHQSDSELKMGLDEVYDW
jgi:PBSX family phage terminase large subunit